MRQLVRALIIGGVLFSAAACGTATNPAPGGPGVGIGSAVAPAPGAVASDSSIKSSCEAIGKVYSKNMAPVAEALSKLTEGADKKTRQQAQQALKAFATDLRGATQQSADPQLRTDGKKTADQLTAKAADADLFSKIKTTEDVNTVLGSTLKQWLSPIEQHCS
ncbi:hypothetical protein [Actinoplanes sp. NPDC049599]|uniref:hypothetical protein n=1 Tax=Actinoplanes sp. NPDC049599 TaxID=3363903 RepID=UPI003787D067